MEVKEFPVEKEFKKGTGVTTDDVAKLRQWLKTQPHLPEKYITDLDIILTYYSCNNSIEVTKQVMDLNYSLRTLFNVYFTDRKFDSTMEKIFKQQLFVILPTKTKDGSTVLYTQGINTDPNLFDCALYIKALFMTIDLWQYECGTTPRLEVVVNFTGYSMSHLPKIDLKNIQQFMYYVQEAIPVKLNKIHLLNSPSFIDILMGMMKPLLKKEMFIMPHSDGFKGIQHIIPLEAFPQDVGGNYKTLDELKDEVVKKLRANNSFFAQETKKRTEESRRPGKPKTYSDVFGGVDGSFKKLDID